NKQHLREALLFCFNLKQSAAEARRLLEKTYTIPNAPSKTTCEDWFKRFRNEDLDAGNKERSGRPKTIEDADLQALLDEDDTQIQDQLAEALNMTRQGIFKRLHAMGKIQKEGKWVPHEFTER
ncbi:Histone-lysine N-methyltransferase SETMAR, partial [Harpegnathos saltator]